MTEKVRADCPSCGLPCISTFSWETNSKLNPNQVMHQFRCPRCHTSFRKATIEKKERRVWD